jgi:hypothetical protein
MVPAKEEQELVDALNACGGNAQFTVIPDAVIPLDEYSNPELYECFYHTEKVNSGSGPFVIDKATSQAAIAAFLRKQAASLTLRLALRPALLLVRLPRRVCPASVRWRLRSMGAG